MQLALASRSLGAASPLEEDIRVAAITGFPWLVMDDEKLTRFLAQPEFTVRDLKRLFLRTEAAALDGLHLPDGDVIHLPQLEALCKQARRVGVPVVVLRVDQPDARLARLANVAQRWSVVLALAASEGGDFDALRQVVQQLSHPALGLYLDVVALWREGRVPRPADAAYTVLLAVGDVDQNGHSVLPGEGVLPLAGLLAPLLVGGYDSLALLMVDNEDEDQNEEVALPPEAFAQAGYQALSGLLSDVGWVVDDE